jgi:hypothetical protein
VRALTDAAVRRSMVNCEGLRQRLQAFTADVLRR